MADRDLNISLVVDTQLLVIYIYILLNNKTYSCIPRIYISFRYITLMLFYIVSDFLFLYELNYRNHLTITAKCYSCANKTPDNKKFSCI